MRQLPNPRLLRRPTLRHEAQSTSALEGTYEPLERVLAADDDPAEPRMREVINYELMAEHAFLAVETQPPVSVSMLCELQRTLVTGTPHQRPASGRVRSTQVVVGRRDNCRSPNSRSWPPDSFHHHPGWTSKLGCVT